MENQEVEPETAVRPLEARMGSRRKPEQPHRMTAWLVGGGLLCAFWSIGTSIKIFIEDPDPISGPAELFGMVIGSALGSALLIGGLVGIIVHLAAGRRFTPSRGTRHFAIFAVIAGLCALPVSGLVFVGSLAETGSQREIRTVFEEHQARAAEIDARHDIERRAAALREHFEPEAIARPGGLEGAHRAADELETLHRNAFGDINALMLDTEQRLTALSMSGKNREELRTLVAEEKSLSARSEAISLRAIELQKAQLAVLSRTERGWQVENGQFVFQRQRDVNDFNVAGRELLGLGAEVRELQNRQGEAAPAR